jgi:hypothetical protein
MGDMDVDGKEEIYALDCDGIWQFSYENEWKKKLIIPLPDMRTYRLDIGDGDSDGLLEIYYHIFDGVSIDLYQAEYNGREWIKTKVASNIEGTGIGDGDNDGKFEIYALDINGNLRQIKPVPIEEPVIYVEPEIGL